MTRRIRQIRLTTVFGAFALLLVAAAVVMFAATGARSGAAWTAFGAGLAILLIAFGALAVFVRRAFAALTTELDAEVERRRRAEESQRALVEAAAEEALRREAGESQSLESLGHVASGVSHDFNNLLGLILNFAGFVDEEIAGAAQKDGEERWAQARKDLLQVQQAAERGTALTKKLRAFARARSEAPTAVEEKTDAPAAATAGRDSGGQETVLIVEDEDGLREAAGRMLGRHGYRVLSAGGGSAALEMLGDFDGVVDLLITDVVMPDMLGREFAEKARLLRPAARVLFISGHGERVLTKQGRIAPGHSFLEKPFTERALVTKVRACLGALEAAGGAP